MMHKRLVFDFNAFSVGSTRANCMNVDKKDIMQFLRFLTIGGSTALIYLGTLFLQYTVLKIDHNIAITTSYFTSVLFHFLGNRHFTFAAENTPSSVQIWRYICLVILSYFVTLAIVNLSSAVFHLAIYLGVCISIGTNLVINFAIMRIWVFKSHHFEHQN